MRKSFLYFIALATLPLFFACSPQIAEIREDIKKELVADYDNKLEEVRGSLRKEVKELKGKIANLENREKNLEKKILQLEEGGVNPHIAFSQQGREYSNFLPKLELQLINKEDSRYGKLQENVELYDSLIEKLGFGIRNPPPPCPEDKGDRCIPSFFDIRNLTDNIENGITNIKIEDAFGKEVPSSFYKTRVWRHPEYYQINLSIPPRYLKLGNQKLKVVFTREDASNFSVNIGGI